MEPAYRYRARCRRVIDGDTLELDVDLGFRVSARIVGRLRGIDAPERGRGGAAATGALTDLVIAYAATASPEPRPLIVESHRDRQTFARWVVDVYLTDTGTDVGRWLVEMGFAKPSR